jgi:hypothetical protein
MLGGVKGDPETENAPLFRILARRWRSFVPLKRERAKFSAALVADEAPAAQRAWIDKPRAPIYAHQKIAPRAKITWSPWLWEK